MGTQGTGGVNLVVVDGDPSFAEAMAERLGAVDATASSEPVSSVEEVLERVTDDTGFGAGEGTGDGRDDAGDGQDGGPAVDLDGVLVGDDLDRPVDAVDRLDDAVDVPVVLLADDLDEATVRDAVAAGADDYYPRLTARAQSEVVVERIAAARADSRPDVDALDRSSDRSPVEDPAYREVFENVSDGLVVHDPETGEILDVNGRFCEMNGYDREDLLGETIDVVTASDSGYSYEDAAEKIERAAEEGPQLFEWRNERRNGETFPVEVHLAVVRMHGERRVLASVRDITERKRREREFEQIFHGVQDPIAVYDPDTLDLLDANEAFLDLVNRDDIESFREEGLAEHMVTEEGFTVEKAREIHGRVVETGDPETFDWQGRTSDGERLWLEVKVTPAIIGGEEVTIASHRDVTERRRREREFEQIFHGVHGGITINDPETGEIVDVNDSFCDLLGYDREELFDLGIEGISVASEGFTMERAREIVDEVVETGEPMQFEWAVQTSDGETRWLDVRGTPAEIGGEQRYLSITRDVTERKRREQDLRETEERFRTVTENADEVIFISDGLVSVPQFYDDDADLEVEYISPAYEDVWGRPREELARDPESFTDAIHEADRESYFETLEGMVADAAADEVDDHYDVDFRVEQPDGEIRWVSSRVSPVPREERDRYRWVGIIKDITERKRRERLVQHLHASTDALQDADSREAVCEATVAAAEEVLDLPMAACWLPADDRDGDGEPPLQPVAATEAAWQIPGGPGTFEPGTFEYGIHDGEELVTYEPGERWDQTPFDRTFLVPLGEHGLLGAGEPGVESYDEVTLDAARILARHARSALDRVERARELRESERRFRTIAERVDEIIYLADADTMEVLYLSPGHEEVWGRSLEDVYDDPTAFADAIHPDDYDSFMAARRAMFEDIHAGDPDDSYEFSYRIERPDGEQRWIESTGYPILGEDDQPNRYVALIEDVTERKRREQTLETFHEATRELTATDSRADACRQAVRAAEEVLGFPIVSAHLYDEDTGTLEPAATTQRLAALDVDPPAFGPGDSLAWQVFVDGEPVTSSEPASDVYGPGVSDPDIVLPLGAHGVMLVGAPTADLDDADVELAQILAATLEASLNHVAGERELAEREEELRRQQERAERLERLNAIIRDIEQATVEQSSRTGIEEAACERLTAVDAHDLVWIAEPTVGDDELVPRVSAGDKQSYLDALSGDLGTGAGGHPAVAAYETGDPRAVDNVATDVTGGEWRRTALGHGVQSAVSVPVRHENTVHGVLTVASEAPDAFDEATRDVLAELGRSIGYAITVTEREQALESEGTTELEFTVGDEGLFMVRGAAAADCRVDLERTVRRTGGSFSTFYVVEGADPADLVELADAAASVERAQVVSSDDTSDEDDAADEGGLIKVTAPTWFGSVFTDHGAVVREAGAEDGEGTLVVEAPRGADVRALVEGFQERYPNTELVAQRQRERTVRSLFELQDELQDGLTDRQLEALETAYSAGYFAWPRKTSGEEVADLLGVTQPTFNKHLRTAERTAFRMLLDREYPGSGE